MSLDLALQSALNKRKEKKLYRNRLLLDSPQGVHIRKQGKDFLSFCSNDYLGLANHPRVVERFRQSASKYGVGSGASHLVTGHHREHHALEEALADFTGRPRALLFSTGYMANLGVINALCGRGDAVFEDKINHASLLDGAMLSAASMVRYRHNDIEHLQTQLNKTQAQRKLIAVDGVFSMDGDFAKLDKLATLAKQNDAWLMVDDAHGIGCIGKNGGGSIEHFSLGIGEVPILMGTLGKALGTFGAFVAGSETLIESLIQFSRTYIYTTALPPAVAAATCESLAIIKDEPQRREKLAELISYFRDGCESIGLNLMPSNTAIQPILVGDASKALAISEKLEQKGFIVSAIRPPTVPQGTARLRCTFSAEHEISHVDALLSALGDVFLNTTGEAR